MRTPELVVDIDPIDPARKPAHLKLSIHARHLAPIEAEVERRLPVPDLLPTDLDALRSGYGSAQITEAVADQITEWLLQSDLRRHFGTAVNAAAASQPFRLVIRPHPEVIPDLADIPFELLKLDDDRLALHPLVRGIVHTPRRRRASLARPARRPAWPFRVLLVRTNPRDLGGTVPPALPIGDHILEVARACGIAEGVKVVVLSSEAGAGGPVTYDALRDELSKGSYDLLVYLGHGDLQDVGFRGLPSIGVLLFELAGSPFADQIRADQLRSALQDQPVPIVVLAGCLTAASGAASERLPNGIRGGQSVAYSLIPGESGVEWVIGMRYRLETLDADRFLRVFLRSLLKEAPGDVEKAVRAGRHELFQQKPYPPSWSAPVLFCAANTEPLFDFLCSLPAAFDPLDEQDQALRSAVWKAMSKLPATLPPEARRFPISLLATVEHAFLERRQRQGASLLWPARIEAKPGDTVRVCVHYMGPLPVSHLEGRLSFSEEISAQTLPRPAPAIGDAGMQVFFAAHRPGEVGFLARGAAGEPATRRHGPLFEVDLTLPGAFPAVHELRIESLACEPKRLLCGWNNAIVVSPP